MSSFRFASSVLGALLPSLLLLRTPPLPACRLSSRHTQQSVLKDQVTLPDYKDFQFFDMKRLQVLLLLNS